MIATGITGIFADRRDNIWGPKRPIERKELPDSTNRIIDTYEQNGFPVIGVFFDVDSKPTSVAVTSKSRVASYPALARLNLRDIPEQIGIFPSTAGGLKTSDFDFRLDRRLNVHRIYLSDKEIRSDLTGESSILFPSAEEKAGMPEPVQRILSAFDTEPNNTVSSVAFDSETGKLKRIGTITANDYDFMNEEKKPYPNFYGIRNIINNMREETGLIARMHTVGGFPSYEGRVVEAFYNFQKSSNPRSDENFILS